MAEDAFITPIAAALLSCLTTQVNLQPNPPEHLCYRVGPEVAHDAGIDVDLCCEGIGYVSLGDIYPSSASFPEQDIVRQAQAKCAPVTWAVNFKVGIIRCSPTGDAQSPPTCAEWNEAFAQNVYDSLSLRRTQCCIRRWVMNDFPPTLGMSVVMERQVQGSPLGGCVERYFNIAIQIPNCDCNG